MTMIKKPLMICFSSCITSVLTVHVCLHSLSLFARLRLFFCFFASLCCFYHKISISFNIRLDSSILFIIIDVNEIQEVLS